MYIYVLYIHFHVSNKFNSIEIIVYEWYNNTALQHDNRQWNAFISPTRSLCPAHTIYIYKIISLFGSVTRATHTHLFSYIKQCINISSHSTMNTKQRIDRQIDRQIYVRYSYYQHTPTQICSAQIVRIHRDYVLYSMYVYRDCGLFRIMSSPL